MIIRFKPSEGLKDTINNALGASEPFTTHGKDLFIRYDQVKMWVIRLSTDNDKKFQFNFEFFFKGNVVGSMITPPILPGDYFTLDIAGDIEAPVNFV